MQFVTIHKPKEHFALIAGEKSPTFFTELELVRHLKIQGIDLRKYTAKTLDSENSKFECTTLWTHAN